MKLRPALRAIVSVLLLATAAVGTTASSAAASVPYFELENGRWGGCIDAPGGALNVTLKLEKCINYPTERWIFFPNPGTPGIGTLQNATTHLCAEVNNGTSTPGERVDEWYCDGLSSEQWTMWDLTNLGYHNYFMFEHTGTSECLDTMGGAGSQLAQFPCAASPPQRWFRI